MPDWSSAQIRDNLKARRTNQKIERSLHEEIIWRLAALKPNCVCCPVPNGIFLPARTEEEKQMARRLISQMKRTGQLREGVADLLFLWDTGSGAIELKRPATRTLFERSPAGRLSPAQKSFREQCEALGVPYRIASHWSDVLAALKDWGRC